MTAGYWNSTTTIRDDSEEELVHAVLTNEKNVGSGFDTDRRSGGQGYRKLKEDSYRRRKGCIRKLPVIAGKCVKTAESSAAESLKWASAAFSVKWRRMWQKLRGCACEKPKTPNGELYILRLQRICTHLEQMVQRVDAQKDRAVLGV